jgi:iron complex outermembrane recepter protein
MRTLLCAIILTFAAREAASLEQGTIAGKVRDAKTHEPVANASVVVLGTQRGDVTNFAGEFSIAGIPVGRHRVRASLVGYLQNEDAVETGADGVALLELQLTRDESIRLEEIVVSGSRIHVYPQTDLLTSDVERRWPKDIGEFLRGVPGVSSIRKGGTAMDPVIRGFRQDQVNVQVDGGMRVSGACPNRMDPPTAHVQSEDLEKIEILKGPFSVRFGPTLGAVINLVMEKPERFDAPGLLAQAEAGYESNWGGKRIRASVTAGTPLLDMYLSGGMKSFGNYTAGDGSEVQSSYRMNDYSLKIGSNPGEQERLQFTNRGSYMRDVYYPALPMDALFDDTHMYALDYAKKSIGEFLSSLSAKGYATYVDHSMGNQWKPTYSTMHARTDVESRTVGGKVEALLTPMPSLFLYAGADGYELMKTGDRTREYLSGPNAGRTFLDTIWQDSYLRSVGGYLEGRIFLSDPLTLIAGLRLDHTGITTKRPNAYFTANYADWLDVTEDNLSGVLAMLYSVSPSMDLRLGIGRGGRTADITERFIYILPIGMDRYDYIGNPTLRPERNIHAEVATSVRIADVAFHASVYGSSLHDFISARVDTTVKKMSPDALGVKRFVNVADASMAGFEVGVSAGMARAIRGNLALSYTYGQNKDFNEPLPEMPPLSAVITLQYQQQESPTWVELEGRCNARQSRISRSFQEDETPGFVLLSLRAGTQIGEHVILTGAVTNILNTAYYEHLNRMNRSDGRAILEPGRAFALNLQLVY